MIICMNLIPLKVTPNPYLSITSVIDDNMSGARKCELGETLAPYIKYYVCFHISINWFLNKLDNET
jgi:hypothetical protein